MFKIGDRVVFITPAQNTVIDGVPIEVTEDCTKHNNAAGVVLAEAYINGRLYRQRIQFDGDSCERSPLVACLRKIEPPKQKEETTTWSSIKNICGYTPDRTHSYS